MRRKNKDELVKKNLSSLQVLKTLSVLMEDDYTMQELIERLNEDEKIPVFNSSVVSKYINTCRYCGIMLPKIQNRYFVSSVPFGLDFTESESNLLKNLKSCARFVLSSNSNTKFTNFLRKLNRYSNKQILRVEEDNMREIFLLFEQSVKEKNRIILMLRSKVNLNCFPIAIIDVEDKKYFKVSCDGKERLIHVDRVSGMEILRYKNHSQNTETVIFKLTDKLASNYNIRENENVLNSNLPNSVTISNKDEQSVLIPRLLRYGELCEVTNPKHVRNEIKQIIDDTLANYGE